MTKIVTDNSKVNFNLLKEVEFLRKTNKQLENDKQALNKQLILSGIGKCVLCNKPTEKLTINYCDTCLEDYNGIE